MENYIENNNVQIGGEIISEVEFSHEVFEEKFYRFSIKTRRLSNYEDELPIIISERILNLDEIKVGRLARIEGQFRSYNMPNDGKNKLVLSIFTKEIEFTDDQDILTLNDANFVGYICKTPIYRKTPLGREIADVLVAVNRTYKKSDYIPCILWGRNAKFSENMEIGTPVKLNGRIQSRTYEKKLDNGELLRKIAYEVSIAKFAKIENEE